ncbi:MAG: hypothetical protein K2I83_02940, partial [Bacteroidales bacterium]|nr:hypothetical protein [Bacteroidales bacterium]
RWYRIRDNYTTYRGSGDSLIENNLLDGDRFYAVASFADNNCVVNNSVYSDTATFSVGDKPEALQSHQVAVHNHISCVPDDSTYLVITPSASQLAYNLLYSVDSGRTWQTDSIFGNLAEGRYYVSVKADGGCDPETMLAVYVQNQPDYEFDTLSFRIDTIYACNGMVDLFPSQRADSATGLGYIGWFEDSAMTKFLKRSPEYAKSHTYLPEKRFLDTVGIYEFWAVESAGLCVGTPNKFVYVVSSCDATLTPKRDTICSDDTVLYSLVIDSISLRNAGGWFFQYSADSKFTPASTQNIAAPDTAKTFRDNRAGSYRVAYITPNRDTLYHEPSTLWVGTYADPSKYLSLTYPKVKATDMCPGDKATFTFYDKDKKYEVLWPGDTVGKTYYATYKKEFQKTDTVRIRIRSLLGGCESDTLMVVKVRQSPTIDLTRHDTTLCFEEKTFMY